MPDTFHNRPKPRLIPSSACISVRDIEKSIEVNLIVGALTFHKDPNHLFKIIHSLMKLQRSNLGLDDKRPCPLSTASSVLCWDPVTLLKMNGDLLKYSSSEQGKQVWVRAE